MNSLPVAFGVDGAKYICVATIDVTQLSVAAYLYAGLHEPTYAAVLLGLTLPQVGDGGSDAIGAHHGCAAPSYLAQLLCMKGRVQAGFCPAVAPHPVVPNLRMVPYRSSSS